MSDCILFISIIVALTAIGVLVFFYFKSDDDDDHDDILGI